MFDILLFLKDVNNVNIDAKTIVAKPWIDNEQVNF